LVGEASFSREEAGRYQNLPRLLYNAPKKRDCHFLCFEAGSPLDITQFKKIETI
jgi:hypothetical protein